MFTMIPPEVFLFVGVLLSNILLVVNAINMRTIHRNTNSRLNDLILLNAGLRKELAALNAHEISRLLDAVATHIKHH